MGFGVECFQIVVGDEHAVAAQGHHFAIVFKQIAVKVAAMVNGFVQPDRRIAFELKHVAESMDVEKGIFSDGQEGGFAILQNTEVGFFAQMLKDDVSDGMGLVGC